MSQSMGDDNFSSLDTNEAEIEPENMREKFFRAQGEHFYPRGNGNPPVNVLLSQNKKL